MANVKKCEVTIVDGQELRDEFTCPITRALMRVPVIAADGHTYDRAAIEQWLSRHEISPRTGEVLEHRILVPNHNLKRLIDDLVVEGGAGLYSKEAASVVEPETCRGRSSSSDSQNTLESICEAPVVPTTRRRLELVSEPLLLLQCLGPLESEWSGRSFEVTRDGVVGGRRQPNSGSGGSNNSLPDLSRRSSSSPEARVQRDFMPFADSTVSRRHFEIECIAGQFSIRDMGSASGTFRRVKLGAHVALRNGDIAMIGLHQLVAKRRQEGDELQLECCAPDGSPLQGRSFTVSKTGATIGRRPSNQIRFFAEVDGEPMGVDSSVSAEHARVSFDEKSQTFQLHDGSADGRPSTNGTWIRLSAIHTPSESFPLESGDELLIGTIRFHVTLTHSIVERESNDNNKS